MKKWINGKEVENDNSHVSLLELDEGTKSLVVAKIVNVVKASMVPSAFTMVQPTARSEKDNDYFLVLSANFPLYPLYPLYNEHDTNAGRYKIDADYECYKHDDIYVFNICTACGIFDYIIKDQIILYRVETSKTGIFNILNKIENGRDVYFLVPPSRIKNINWITDTVGISNNIPDTDGYTCVTGIYYRDEYSPKDLFNDDRLTNWKSTGGIIFDNTKMIIDSPSKNKFIKTFYGTFINGSGKEYTTIDLSIGID